MLSLIAVCLSSALADSHVNAKEDPVATLAQSLYNFYLEFGDCTQMDFCSPAEGGCGKACEPGLQLLSKMDPKTFTWSDVAYNDTTPSTWLAVEHLKRTVTMAQALQCPRCETPIPAPTRQQLQAACLGALRWWLKADPPNSNWWWQDFGTPQYLMVLISLLNKYVTQEDVGVALKFLHRADSQFGATGQNAVWALQVGINRGVIEGNGTLVSSLFTRLWADTIVQAKGVEGIQPDGTFYQHNHLLQNGAYGADSFLNLLNYMAFSIGTPYAPPAKTLDVLALYVLDAEQLMVRWNGRQKAGELVIWWDLSVKCREISRAPLGVQPVSHAPLLDALDIIATHPDLIPRAKEWIALRDRFSGKGENLERSKHFWLGDYTIHARKEFFNSVKMLSPRMLNAESANSENIRGWHTSDGVVFTYQTGAEYAGIFPVWDWDALPGTTLHQGLKGETVNKVQIKGTSPFAGGCINPNNLGVSAFQFTAANFGDEAQKRLPLRARKSWFWLDTGYVALGADITITPTSTTANDPSVRTTIDQSLFAGSMVVNGKSYGVNSSFTVDADPNTWVHHANVLILPALEKAGGKLVVSSHTRFGSWKLLSNGGPPGTVSHDVFFPQLDHGAGAAVKDKTYAYAVLPATPLNAVPDARMKFNSAVHIVSNTPTVQSIRVASSTLSTVFMAAVYGSTLLDQRKDSNAGAEEISAGNFSTSCLLTVTERKDGKTIEFAIAKPSLFNNTYTPHEQNAVVSFAVNRKLSTSSPSSSATAQCGTSAVEGWSTVSISLPTGSLDGSTVVASCKLA